jgi:transmembrane sensor
MVERHDMIKDQAIAWAIRTRAADFDEWEAFTAWLEEDPQHNLAYENVLSAEDAFLDLAGNPGDEKAGETSLPPPANDIPANDISANDDFILAQARPNRRRMMVGAIAASLVAAVSVGVWTQMPQPYDVMTGPGQREIVALPDGSQITVNGNTKIALDHKKPRYARLERGEALFTVVHDDDNPFIVDTGRVRLVDAGTEFNVMRSDEALDVAVSEGLVIYNPDRENVRLPAGKRLYRSATQNRVTVSDIVIEQVGSWRTGRLSFADATMGEVAQALDRNLAVGIAISPDIAEQRFSGVIQLDDREPQNIDPIAAVLGLRAQKQEKGWILIGDDALP